MTTIVSELVVEMLQVKASQRPSTKPLRDFFGFLSYVVKHHGLPDSMIINPGVQRHKNLCNRTLRL